MACMSRLCAPGPVIGVDLAWGTKSPTGLTILDAEGGLVLCRSLTTDDELDEELAPWLAGSCLVAMDAPLIVVNETGRRPCEAALSRAFAAQHAGAYPCNTGLPTFADGGRAARFAKRHGLSVDATVEPAAGQRRAIEVYPHSATVALFNLPKVLPYKARTGRTLESRREALLWFVDLLAGLPGLADPSGIFPRLRREVTSAPTGAALRRSEDPIDSIMCAYVGRLFQEAQLFPDVTTVVIGDAETGAIVTPVRDRHLALLGLVAKPSDRFSFATNGD